MSITLTVLGSSGSYPSAHNPASGYVVRRGSTAVVLDLGSGSLSRLIGAIGVAAVDALVISHVHADHCSDLFSFFIARARSSPDPQPVTVFVPDGAAEHFIRFARAEDPDHLFRTLMDFQTVAGGDRAKVGELALRFADTHHPVPTIATRVSAGDASLVYTADTGPSDEVTVLARRADVLLCEAAMVGPREDDTYPFHITAEEAGDMATRAAVGQLILTHLPPSLASEPSVEAATARYAGPVSLAVPGMQVTVG